MMTRTRVMGVGWLPAKRAKNLRIGDVIMRPYGQKAAVLGVVRTARSVHLRLRSCTDSMGPTWPKTKRPNTLVGLAV